jgi:hypothetical protein
MVNLVEAHYEIVAGCAVKERSQTPRMTCEAVGADAHHGWASYGSCSFAIGVDRAVNFMARRLSHLLAIVSVSKNVSILVEGAWCLGGLDPDAYVEDGASVVVEHPTVRSWFRFAPDREAFAERGFLSEPI